MKKISSKKIFVIIFFVVLYLPMIFTNYSHNVRSEFDNKMLEDFPKIGEKDFNKKLENCLGERIGFRKTAITMYQVICDRLFVKLVHPAYVYGKNRDIYSFSDLETYQHLDPSEEYMEDLTGFLDYFDRYCKKRNIDFIFFLCPNKESVYYENFPKGYNIKLQKNRSDMIEDFLRKQGISYIFPRDRFLEMKDEALLYNVKYDVLHWNDTGSFYGMKQLLEKERSLGYKVCELDESDFNAGVTVEKYLPQSFFVINETVPKYTLKEDNAGEDSKEYFEHIAVDNNHYHKHFINREKPEAPRVLVMGDSYFGSPVVQDSLKICSSELLIVHICSGEHMGDYIERFNPDIVVLEAVERDLGESSFWASEEIEKWTENLASE